jgi:hypothetical protein
LFEWRWGYEKGERWNKILRHINHTTIELVTPYSSHLSKVDWYGILMGEIANKLDFNKHCQWDLSPTYGLIMQIYFSYFHPIIKGTHSQSYTNVVQFND